MDLFATLLAELYSGVPDRQLFHYTSMDGLVGITQSRALWASEIRYLNDEQELRHFTTLMDYFSLSCADMAEGDSREILKQLRDWLRLWFEHGPLIFTGSFTSNGNLLSQWRGYCPHGQGVSLGFDPGLVAGTIAGSGFAIGRCIYDPVRQREVARRTVLALLDRAKVSGPDGKLHHSQCYWTTFHAHEQDIMRIGALIKHPSFSEEDEWRCVSAPVYNFREAPVLYRSGRNFLIPYLPLPLPEVGGGLAVIEVFVGPSPAPNQALHSVSMYLAKHAGQGFQRIVSACGIPYRP